MNLRFDSQNLRIINDSIIQKDNNIIINITGDWSPAFGGMSDILIEKGSKFYNDLIGYFKTADLNIVNLETVIDDQKRNFLKTSTKLIDKKEVLNSLKSMKAQLVCLANNHIMDNGVEGLRQTINNLEEWNIDYIGAGFGHAEIYKSYFFKKDKTKIAIVNAADGEEANEKYNDNIGASDIESYKIVDAIRQSKKNGYYLILILHAGIEFLPTPPPYIQKLYRNFIEEGADLIVGHHPHVPQGVEIYKNKPIFYSLGNFVMWKNNWKKNTYHSYFISVNLAANELQEIKTIPYEIGKLQLKLIDKSYFSNLFHLLNTSLNEYSNLVWHEYLKRRSLTCECIRDVLALMYNSSTFKIRQLNNYKTIGKRYLHIDSYSNNLKVNPKIEKLLDDWEIYQNYPFLTKILDNLENRLLSFYSIFKKIRAILRKFQDTDF